MTFVLLGLVTLILLAAATWSSTYWTARRGDGNALRQDGRRAVTIVVLGDFGRSPRMQYHAESFLRAGWLVRVVAYAGTLELASLRSSDDYTFFPIREHFGSLSRKSKLGFTLLAPIKIFTQIVSLMLILAWSVPQSDYLLVQTPPAIPTLAVVQITCALRGQRLLLDWHNLGFTILAMSLGKSHFLVHLAERLEMILGRRAFAHITVTNAMLDFLRLHVKIRAKHSFVLYDCPPAHFACTPREARRAILDKYSLARGAPSSSAVLVSSTSWTADEDFTILLDALALYHVQSTRDKDLRPLVVIITGKGPLKSTYEQKIRLLEQKWRGSCPISVELPWLEAEDYPRLLGSADLGICLHTSSSGLDLPMKVVDMFGCGVPVCAYSYPCISELVQDDVNGKIFTTGQQLGEILVDLLRNAEALERMSNAASLHFRQRWTENWQTGMLPLMEC